MSTDKEMPFNCEYCKQTLSSKFRLQEHQKTCATKRVFDENKLLSLISSSSSKEYEAEFINLLFNKAIISFDKQLIEKYKELNIIDDDIVNKKLYQVIKDGDTTRIEFLSTLFDMTQMILKYIYTDSSNNTTTNFLKKLINLYSYDSGYLDTTITEKDGKKIKTITYYEKPLFKGEYYKNTTKLGDKILLPTVQIFINDILEREEHYVNNLLHGKDAVKIYIDGILREKYSYYEGKVHDLDFPAHTKYDEKEQIIETNSYSFDKLYSDVITPATVIYKNGKGLEKIWKTDDGKLSRKNRPAIIRYQDFVKALAVGETISSDAEECEYYEDDKKQMLYKINFKDNQVSYYINKNITNIDCIYYKDIDKLKNVIIKNSDDELLNYNTKYFNMECITFRKYIYIPFYDKSIECYITEYYKVDKSGNIIIHRDSYNGPAQIVKDENGRILIKRYFEEGRLLNKNHEDCWEEYDDDGNIFISFNKNTLSCVYNTNTTKNIKYIDTGYECDTNYVCLDKQNNSKFNNSLCDYFVCTELYENNNNKPKVTQLDKSLEHCLKNNITNNKVNYNLIKKNTNKLSSKVEIILKFPWEHVEDSDLDFFINMYIKEMTIEEYNILLDEIVYKGSKSYEKLLGKINEDIINIMKKMEKLLEKVDSK
jgi:hypothetical protein